MRLQDHERIVIKEIVRSLDADARVLLYGSRVDDSKKGGDIDLLILSKHLGYGDKLTIRQKLNNELGEQKIDILIADDILDPFAKIAHDSGVAL